MDDNNIDNLFDDMDNLPPAFLEALEALYSTNPTNAQKINILINEVGDCNVSYMGMFKDPPEEHERMKMIMMELDYLEKIGIYKPDFY